MPNFGVIACVGPAWGRQTHTHTYFHLYVLDCDLIQQDIVSCSDQLVRVYDMLYLKFIKIESASIFSSETWL